MIVNDIFISYAHIDDESLIVGEQGWITAFHFALEKRLNMLVGERIKIWRDIERLEGNDMFAEKIASQFSKTAILIVIITPRYLRSEWCLKELNEFKRISDSNIGFRINDKVRVFKVIKTPVDINSHPSIIQDTLGYNFFIRNSLNKRYIELTLDSDTRKEYVSKLDELAWDIKNMLEQIKIVVNESKENELKQKTDEKKAKKHPPKNQPKFMQETDGIKKINEEKKNDINIDDVLKNKNNPGGESKPNGKLLNKSDSDKILKYYIGTKDTFDKYWCTVCHAYTISVESTMPTWLTIVTFIISICISLYLYIYESLTWYAGIFSVFFLFGCVAMLFPETGSCPKCGNKFTKKY